MRHFLAVCAILTGIGYFMAPAFGANWPNTISTDGNLYIAVNNLYTTLTEEADASTTTIHVNSTAGFPSRGYVVIGSEAILYTSSGATTLDGLTRGADGTTAASHANKSLVYANLVADHHNVLKDELIAMSTFFFQGYVLKIATTTPEVTVSSASSASHGVGLGGAHDSLPISGYAKGTMILLTSDNSVYVATEAVTSTGSWEKVGAQ